MIRDAKFADMPQLVALFEDAHRRSKYASRAALDLRECKRILVQAMQRHGGVGQGSSFVRVAENDGKVEALIVGIIDRVYHVTDKLYATDLFWLASEQANPRDSVGLMKSMVRWASENPAVIEIRVGATDVIANHDRMAPLYERMGFRACGAIFERRTDA